jgi:hypothetical protein
MKIWLNAFRSVICAFVGVQSEKNRRHDFEEGRFSVFVVAGISLTFLFLISVYGLVQLVMMYVQF